jgi:hypothetical protein
MGLWTRGRDGHDTRALVHYCDRGVQYVATAIPNDSPRPAPSRPLGARATRMTTRWPRRSTHCSKPNWSATADLGRHRRPRDRGRRVHRLVQLPQAPWGDRARPTSRVRDHLPQHNPPRAACSAGVGSLHQTRYLTDPVRWGCAATGRIRVEAGSGSSRRRSAGPRVGHLLFRLLPGNCLLSAEGRPLGLPVLLTRGPIPALTTKATVQVTHATTDHRLHGQSRGSRCGASHAASHPSFSPLLPRGLSAPSASINLGKSSTQRSPFSC